MIRRPPRSTLFPTPSLFLSPPPNNMEAREILNYFWAASFFVFEKRLIEKLSRSDNNSVIAGLKRGVQQLTRLRHPTILSVLHPIEESRYVLSRARWRSSLSQLQHVLLLASALRMHQNCVGQSVSYFPENVWHSQQNLCACHCRTFSGTTETYLNLHRLILWMKWRSSTAFCR